MAVAGALTPLVKVAHKHWFRSVLLYTLSGTASALSVGVLLSLMGAGLKVNRAVWLIVPLGLALAARDLKWLSFRIPERQCQTEKVWAHEFGFLTASAMWGFHLGFGFTTYIRYGGFWFLTATVLAMGEAEYGALLLVMYWMGRATSVWAMPLIWRNQDASEIAGAVMATRRIYDLSDAVALIWSAGILAIWLLRNTMPEHLIGHV
jgi:hypothetical protein